MPVIGLTGSIASGKSFVTKILKELGARIIDADVIARQIVEPGTVGWQQIKEAFGEEVLNPDLTVSRKKLADIVFPDRARMRKLNEITHPIIIQNIKEEINRFRMAAGEPTRVLVVDAPLLIETGLHELVDEVWVVDIPEELQIRRLMERDGLTREQALDRIGSQMPAAEKKKYADVVIDNSGDFSATRKTVEDLWKQHLTKSGVETVGKQETQF